MTTPVLAVAGHKGGTGRTTTTLALGMIYAAAGLRVGLIDADPTRALSLLVPQDEPNLQLTTTNGDADGFGLILMDCPPLHDATSLTCLERATGVLLTSAADLVSLRTLGLASKLLTLALQRRRQLEFHGLLLTQYEESDPVQRFLAEQMRRTDGDLFINVEIPEDAALRFWPEQTSEPLPEGPARDAYLQLAEELAERLELLSRISN